MLLLMWHLWIVLFNIFEKSEQCMSPYRNNYFTSASNTKAYRDCIMGTTENFVPKTFNMKTGGVSRVNFQSLYMPAQVIGLQEVQASTISGK